jgi:hypothetical protein
MSDAMDAEGDSQVNAPTRRELMTIANVCRLENC